MHDGATGRARAGLVVGWTQLTVALSVIAIASLGTLVTVVSVQNIDVLSTVALVLAVLAFAAQLIVSLAQAQGAAQQLSAAERVNSQTQAALAEIRSTVRALLSNQSDQFDKVLGAALHAAIPSAVRAATSEELQVSEEAGAIDVDGLASRLEDRLGETLQSALNGAVHPNSAFRLAASRRPLSAAPAPRLSAGQRRTLVSPITDEEADRARTVVRDLSGLEADAMFDIAKHINHEGRAYGRPLAALAMLIDKGLVRTIVDPDAGRTYLVPVDDGWLVARYLMYGGPGADQAPAPPPISDAEN